METTPPKLVLHFTHDRSPTLTSMNGQDKPMSKDTLLEGPQESPSISEPSSTPLSSEDRRRPHFSTASDGRVTLTFPSSGAWSAQHQGSSPQPARYEPMTPASEMSLGENGRPSHEKMALLRLMTDESLAAMLDSSDTEVGSESNPGAGDLEAWVDSSKQTIIRQNDDAESKCDDNKP